MIIDTLLQPQGGMGGGVQRWYMQMQQHKAQHLYTFVFLLFLLICPSHSVNLCQLVDCQFGDTFLERSLRVFAAGPLSVAPSNTATNWNVVQLWESSQDLN